MFYTNQYPSKQQDTVLFIEDINGRSVLEFGWSFVLHMDDTRQSQLLVPLPRHDGAMLFRYLMMPKHDVPRCIGANCRGGFGEEKSGLANNISGKRI